MSDDPQAPAPRKHLSTWQLLGLVCVFFLFGSILSRINLFGPKDLDKGSEAGTPAASNAVEVVTNEVPVAIETNRP